MPNIEDKLFDLLCESEYMDWDKKIEYLIANGVTVQKWIPVSKRLPEMHTKVLCCGIKGGRFIAELSSRGNEQLYWTKRDGKGCPAVTHWIPLPEPPAPEKSCQPHGAEQFAKACAVCVKPKTDLCRECTMEKKSGFEAPF